jgi:hypothetical protein
MGKQLNAGVPNNHNNQMGKHLNTGVQNNYLAISDQGQLI